MTDLYSVSDIRKCFPWMSQQKINHRIMTGMNQVLKEAGGKGYKHAFTLSQVVHVGVIDTLAKLGALHAKDIDIQYWHKDNRWGGPTLRDLCLLDPEYYQTCNYRTVIDVTVNLGKHYLNFWPSLETREYNHKNIIFPFFRGAIFVPKIHAEVIAGLER